jgi:hypothetical protein
MQSWESKSARNAILNVSADRLWSILDPQPRAQPDQPHGGGSLGPEQSEVQIKTTAHTEGVKGTLVKPLMTRQFSRAIDGFLKDLKIFAESGKISSKNTKVLDKAGR